jgi:hypothetical protein
MPAARQFHQISNDKFTVFGDVARLGFRPMPIGDSAIVSGCKSLSWAPFETSSRLSRLEARAFSWSGLQSIHLPASVTVIGENCFSDCESVTSIKLNPAHNYLNLQTGDLL